MKLILVGYPGSEKISIASRYLIDKYMPGFEVNHLNYSGEIEEWSKFISDYLSTFDDTYIIFALDDYLLAHPIDVYEYNNTLLEMKDAALAKLCVCTEEENKSYPVTTQYTIWNRRYLIELLDQVTTPWEFELKGSKLFKASNKKALFKPILKYHTNSSLSSKWGGVDLSGLNEEDLQTVKEMI